MNRITSSWHMPTSAYTGILGSSSRSSTGCDKVSGHLRIMLICEKGQLQGHLRGMVKISRLLRVMLACEQGKRSAERTRGDERSYRREARCQHANTVCSLLGRRHLLFGKGGIAKIVQSLLYGQILIKEGEEQLAPTRVSDR